MALEGISVERLHCVRIQRKRKIGFLKLLDVFWQYQLSLTLSLVSFKRLEDEFCEHFAEKKSYRSIAREDIRQGENISKITISCAPALGLLSQMVAVTHSR